MRRYSHRPHCISYSYKLVYVCTNTDHINSYRMCAVCIVFSCTFLFISTWFPLFSLPLWMLRCHIVHSQLSNTINLFLSFHSIVCIVIAFISTDVAVFVAVLFLLPVLVWCFWRLMRRLFHQVYMEQNKRGASDGDEEKPLNSSINHFFI